MLPPVSHPNRNLSDKLAIVTKPSDKKPPEGSHVVSPLAGNLTLGGFTVTANLSQYVDTSSEETKQATIAAIKDITAWVGNADRLTIKHVIDGNLTASNAGVPVGPYDDDLARKIVKTIFDDAEGLRSEQRDWTKSRITWLLSLAGLILTAVMVWLAYLRFFSDN